MNYLQLVARLRQDCGVSGTGPTSVLNQTGEYKRLVDWTAEAYVDIQNRHRGNWRWLRSEFTLATVASDDEYLYSDATDSIDSATISRFAKWVRDDMKIYLTSAGVATQGWLQFLPWENFNQMYRLGTQTPSYPSYISIDPRNRLRLGPKPNGIYTVTGEYQKSAQSLTADATTPEMPSDFHMLIVYEAMKKYAAYESAPEVWARARTDHARMMRDLEVDQLPEPQYGDALA